VSDFPPEADGCGQSLPLGQDPATAQLDPWAPSWRLWHYNQARVWLDRAQERCGKNPNWAGVPDGSTDALAAAKIAEVHLMLGDRCGGDSG
jgi:hypothetical protein